MSKASKFIGAAKKAITKKNKFVDHRGLNTKKSYSSFWMDDYDSPATKFSGLNPNSTQSSDTVKLVKLSNYRRAITNFVKIVTKKDIPVTWHGDQSYTDGRAITLSSDIKDSTFDVTVGLALHESSHIVLTDFDTMRAITQDNVPAIDTMVAKYCVPANTGQRIGTTTVNGMPLLCSSMEINQFVRDMLNWIEDRRIDNYIFSTSPGYKAYYHKLYDYYWNSNDVMKGFITDQFAQPGELDHWMFHIVNCINPNFNSKALPRLDEIVELIDLKNISRLQSSWESLDIACAVTDIVFEVASEYWTEPTKTKPKENEIGPGSQDKDGAPQPSNNNDTTNSPADINEDGPSSDDGSGTTGNDSADTEQPLSPSDMRALQKALDKQKDFLNGRLNKKAATQRLQKKLEQIAKQEIEVQQVGGEEGVESTSTLTYDLTNSARMLALGETQEEYTAAQKKYWDAPYDDPNRDQLRQDMRALEEKLEECAPSEFFSKYESSNNVEAIQAGLDMGGLLGKKLQLHNESRERVDNRLRNGRIDNKRLAHAGYGIENVFSQIHIDKYKKANLHISLDGSGSMSGRKWAGTVQMTVAIAKAASYTQNINVQVSLRVTKGNGRGDAPVVLSIYDSRKNKLNHLVATFKSFSPNSMTPEGLCFEAMVKKNMLIPSSSELDSYFLNISDGYPQCGSYSGDKATRHTAKWINKIKSIYNIKVLSFWMENSREGDNKTAQEIYDNLVRRFNSGGDGQTFRSMYGKDASVVDSSSAIMIARELNKKFMQPA